MGKLSLSREYKEWLADLKGKIRQVQVKASLQVNNMMLQFYWNLGQDVTERQKKAKWGSGFLTQLSKDLMAEFPDMKGFSVQNLRFIKRFYIFYFKILEKRLHLAGELAGQGGNRLQPASDLALADLFRIPWWHHVILMTKCRTAEEALFYVQKTIEGNWSRSVLLNSLETGYYEASGKAVTNFAAALPLPQGDLARQTLKDPYVFDFLTMRAGYDEHELENALTDNITRFLLELGTGFAYVGRQICLHVGAEEFFIDLLFYHLRLRCYVVIELKTVKFEPSQLGQLGFYVTAVNEQLRHPTDAETIGLLICKTKDKVVAEYALKNASQPLGISEYKLNRLLPKDYRSSLPTIEEIEAELTSKAGGTKPIKNDKAKGK